VGGRNRRVGMLGGLMAARMVAVIERDGQRDEVVVAEPLEIRDAWRCR
jgi:hypothetical protein